VLNVYVSSLVVFPSELVLLAGDEVVVCDDHVYRIIHHELFEVVGAYEWLVEQLDVFREVLSGIHPATEIEFGIED
jgi:hypothetical protein